MTNLITLPGKLSKFGHPPISWLPKAYQPFEMGGDGRTKHEDWVLFKNTTRESTAYAIPLPFRKVSGNGEPVLMPVQNDDYPIVPGTPVEMKVAYDPKLGKERLMRHVLTMMSVHPLVEGGPRSVWSRQEAFINGVWTEVFYTRSVNIMGSKWLCYAGLKLDEDGPMCHFPEVSGSIKWNYLV